MIFRNRNKLLMYKTLLKFDKCKSINDTRKYIINKYKLTEDYFTYLIGQCVELQLIDGISVNKSINNNYFNVYSKNIYLTYNGYEFIKNYYGWLKKLLRDLLLITITAIITVLVENKLNPTKQVHNQECQCYSNK